MATGTGEGGGHTALENTTATALTESSSSSSSTIPTILAENTTAVNLPLTGPQQPGLHQVQQQQQQQQAQQAQQQSHTRPRVDLVTDQPTNDASNTTAVNLPLTGPQQPDLHQVQQQQAQQQQQSHSRPRAALVTDLPANDASGRSVRRWISERKYYEQRLSSSANSLRPDGGEILAPPVKAGPGDFYFDTECPGERESGKGQLSTFSSPSANNRFILVRPIPTQDHQTIHESSKLGQTVASSKIMPLTCFHENGSHRGEASRGVVEESTWMKLKRDEIHEGDELRDEIYGRNELRDEIYEGNELRDRTVIKGTCALLSLLATNIPFGKT
ncbi:hypothetical protein WN55_09290 [Dufourea novaeangliae]|uniref:Uncharacterized protein n=1 Tax=Dufourea novaeangliae TaxID=178035 RepID=A0A154P8X8_DUFNO|nr:hypothetical protein WN55_09290 [Dufourea novaeangliae]